MDKYQQAVNYQQLMKGPDIVVKMRRFYDRVEYTTRGGAVHIWSIHQKNRLPLMLVGNE